MLPGKQRPDALRPRPTIYAPAGIGLEGLEWAKGNDRRLLTGDGPASGSDRAGARDRLNACGGGAIAAMLAACRDGRDATAKSCGTRTVSRLLRDVAPHGPENAVGTPPSWSVSPR